MAQSPITISYEAIARITITSPPDGSGNSSIIFPRILPGATLSQDLLNQMSSSFSFGLEDAVRFFPQFTTFNAIQHGSKVVVEFNDISGGILTDPLPVDGWIKKGTFNIIDPNPSAEANSRSMAILSVDKMWSVTNSKVRIVKGTPTEPIVGHLTPIDSNNLVYQVIDKAGDPILDLDEETIPIITRFVKTDASPFFNPFPAGRTKVLSPNDFTVNYELGKIVFKKEQSVGVSAKVFGYNVTAHKFSQNINPYQLEDVLQDFLESTQDFGGVGLTFGTDFDFFDPNGNSRFTFGSTNFVGVSSNVASNTITVVGAFTSYFVAGVLFRAKLSSPSDLDGTYTVVSSLAAGPFTVITVEEDVTVNAATSVIERYFDTQIKVSRIDWHTDSGTGRDFIQMLRDSGVMPFNYFLRADVDNFIRR